MSIKYFSITTIFLLTSHFLLAQANCDLKKDANGIRVWLCDSEMSKFKKIKVELEMPATLSQYAAMVLDVNKYGEWQYRNTKQQILKMVSPTEFYYYSEVQTPWPTTNRDMIFHSTMWQDSLTKVLYVSLVEAADFIPHKDGIVRIPKAESLLTVTPIDKRRVSVKYVLDIDPGGEVPAWIANLFAAEAPWQTYDNFRNRIIEQGDNPVKANYIADF